MKKVIFAKIDQHWKKFLKNKNMAVTKDKWEYKIITPEMKGWITKRVSNNTLEELNTLGKEGWELVGVTPVTANMGTSYGGTTASFVFFFKRKIIKEG